MEERQEEATVERRPATVARGTEVERLDMAEDNIQHQLLGGMGSNRDTVRLWGLMKTLVIKRCVLQFGTSGAGRYF